MSLFADCLGPAFAQLPLELQALHAGPGRWTGRAAVSRGRHPVARVLAAAFRFPPETEDIAVSVEMTRTGNTERWVRRFGSHRFRSHLTPDAAVPGRMWERFGPFSFAIDFVVTGDSLSYPVSAGRLLGLPLPRGLLPISQTEETVEDGRAVFDVALSHPLAGPVVRYRGWLEQRSPDQG